MGETLPIHYRVCPVDPAGHYFEVSLRVEKPDPRGQRFSLPAWIPGSYMIRDFARNLGPITASCGGVPIALEQLDKQSWRAEPCEGPLELGYRVYAWDLSVRSAHLDDSHAYFNGTSLFLRVHDRDQEPCSVELAPPRGDGYRQWRVATTLPRRGAELYGFGLYGAADYDELIDHPVEMADFTLIEFEAAGIPHAMAITGRHRADTERLASDLKAICEYQIDLFGELPPMERYLFLTMAVGDGYGGLEHRSSCSLLCSRDDLPKKGEEKISDRYRNFLGLCSHEYFHTWNVKRIKPAVFIPYDLSRETHTPLLWAFEGFTSYYDDLTLVRCKLIDETSYLELLGQHITRLLRNAGRRKQTVSQSSFDAWSKFYKQDENAQNAIVSYYNKGALIALCLDLTIRSESKGKRSLDDVMRALWQRHGRPGVGVSPQGLEALIEEVSGVELGDFFERYLRSTEELPLEERLARFGVDFHTRPAESQADKGGKAAKNGKSAPYTGLRLAANGNEARVAAVVEGGPAHQAGIAAGDQLIAVDGLKTGRERFEKQLADYQPGERLSVHGFRRDELREYRLSLGRPPEDTCYLTLGETIDAATRQARDRWLNRQ